MLPTETILGTHVSEVTRQEFLRNGVVVLREALPDRDRRRLLNKANLFFRRGLRRDFKMLQSGMTPRHMDVVSGAVTNEDADIMASYRSSRLQDALSHVVSGKVAECDNPIENVIFTRLSLPGDTHGWHLDDYAIAMIMVLEAPLCAEGGYLEYGNNETHRVELNAGDIYLMRSDMLPHRVAPLTSRHARRTILNFTYGMDGLVVSPNGSAQTLLA